CQPSLCCLHVRLSSPTILLVTSMCCSRRGAASDLYRVLHMRRGSLAFVHQRRGHTLKERVWPLHTSRRVPSGCMKIFEALRSRRSRRLGRASDGRGQPPIIMRSKGEHIGTVEAPDREMAEAVSIEQFDLDQDQRRLLSGSGFNRAVTCLRILSLLPSGWR